VTNDDPSQSTSQVSARYCPICAGISCAIFSVPRYISVGPFVGVAATAPAAIIVTTSSGEAIRLRRTHSKLHRWRCRCVALGSDCIRMLSRTFNYANPESAEQSRRRYLSVGSGGSTGTHAASASSCAVLVRRLQRWLGGSGENREAKARAERAFVTRSHGVSERSRGLPGCSHRCVKFCVKSKSSSDVFDAHRTHLEAAQKAASGRLGPLLSSLRVKCSTS
jgi:hypothetical protein